MNWGLGLGLMLGLPAAIALYLMAEPLLAFLYMTFAGSAMTDRDITMAGLALEMFAIALPGFVLVKVLAPAFFAHQDTRTPFRFAAIAVAVNLVGSLSTFQWVWPWRRLCLLGPMRFCCTSVYIGEAGFEPMPRCSSCYCALRWPAAVWR
jgi:peptidoglycan biosynthesis protein MviN/MurJ (putative lipid II flippase)